MNMNGRVLIGGLEHGASRFEHTKPLRSAVSSAREFVKTSVGELPEAARGAYNRLLATTERRTGKLLNRLA